MMWRRHKNQQKQARTMEWSSFNGYIIYIELFFFAIFYVYITLKFAWHIMAIF